MTIKKNLIWKHKIHKIIFILLAISFLTQNTKANQLTDTISIQLEDNTLLEAFNIITEYSGYSFAYVEEFIPGDIKFTKEFKNVSISNILTYLLRGTGISFRIVEEQIILIKKKGLKKYTISGFIRDNETGEALFQANVFDKESFQGAVSNQHGYYSLSLPEGIYTLAYSYIGRSAIEKSIILDKNIELSINLEPSIELKEVVIIGKEKKEIIEKAAPLGKMNISNESIESMPVIMGEPDLAKTIQLIPGVQGGSEANGAIYVRGGGPLQNLFLLDNVPIYNCFHLLGLFSVFNSDIIGNTQVIKGGFPAQYGGRLSSVVDVKTKEGNMKEFKGKVSLGLISSKLFFEGPIIKDRTSFAIGGRMGYYYVYGELLPEEIGNDNAIQNYNFKDINVKLTHRLSKNHKLYLSFYTGDDTGEEINREENTNFNNVYSFHQDVDGQNWNNLIGTIGWAGKISNKIFGNIQVATSQYNYSGYVQDSSYLRSAVYTNHSFSGTELSNNILNYSGSTTIQYEVIPQLKIIGGYKYVMLDLNSKNRQISRSNNYNASEQSDTILAAYDYKTTENTGFLEFQFNLWQVLQINPGVHISYYQNGSYENIILQPRITSSWEFTNDIVLKASYSKMGQHIHLLGATRIKQASDLIVAAGEKGPSEESDQYSLGISYLRFKFFNIHVDAYYKKLYNLINFSEGASYFRDTPNWEDKIEVGTGEAKGIEILAEKSMGKLTGWLGYTFSNTTRLYSKINSGKKFPFIYDHTHYLNLTGKYSFNEKYEIGFNWLYHTGNTSTIPETFYYNYSNRFYGRMDYYGENKVYYNKKNAYRSPSYHRLDISVSYKNKYRWGEGKWTLSVYNVYNRKNVYSSNYNENQAHIIGNLWYTRRYVEEKRLFGIIPSINYTLSF